ncbi:hypothetical protein [Ethanoligenens sp.]|uniref:hypothetical protein n=1 Tax=Ethanoligenens sp. TaxID=2099655 RepID=UPI0039E7AFBD
MLTFIKILLLIVLVPIIAAFAIVVAIGRLIYTIGTMILFIPCMLFTLFCVIDLGAYFNLTFRKWIYFPAPTKYFWPTWIITAVFAFAISPFGVPFIFGSLVELLNEIRKSFCSLYSRRFLAGNPQYPNSYYENAEREAFDAMSEENKAKILEVKRRAHELYTIRESMVQEKLARKQARKHKKEHTVA